MPASSLQSLKEQLLQGIRREKSLRLKSSANGEHRQAAVLVLIYPGQSELEIILTQRSDDLPHHAGQISLPGGTVEEHDESHIHTALREAEEEIGLDSDKVDILGSLDTIFLPSGFAVTPVIGLMQQAQTLAAEPGEVKEIFSIPLPLVLDKSLYKQDSLVRNDIRRYFYCFDYKEYYVWGATAGILRSLSLLLAD